MTGKSNSAWRHRAGVPIAYLLICSLAIGFDLATDRSFGALMLAVLPISLLALACLVVGPWIEGPGGTAALKSWGAGAILILLITIAFSLLGPEQAKTGELIFTYATIIMALPSSFVLPFAATWLDPLLGSSLVVRIIYTWTICVGTGWLEWKALEWLYVRFRRRKRNSATLSHDE